MNGLSAVIKKLKAKNAKRIFLQYPDGIKMRIRDIVQKLESAGFEVVTCLEECFGACDIRDEEAVRIGCDIILHIGHEKFLPQSKLKLPVVYWEYFIDADPLPILEKEFEKLKQYEKIGLITSIQFVHTIPKVKAFLEKHSKKAFTYKALQYEGQVLGCHLTAATEIEASVDCFLCISAGKFYGLGIVLKTEKPVLCLDLERKEIYSLNALKEKIQKIIAWNKSQLDDARNVGILVSWKKGQMSNMEKILELKKRLIAAGKQVYIFAMDEITPDKLEGLKLDAAVVCACPRIGIDDLDRYKIPILNFDQITNNF